MLNRLLLILTIGLIQSACEYGENLYPFEVRNLEKVRPQLEREKRELLQIEDIKVGDGPVATWGRRISADLEVRYADGTVGYRGPIVSYVGFHVALYNALKDPHLLSTAQDGIELGLNGMAVGGHRRITVDRSLVCMNLKTDADPRAACHLADKTRVRKEKLIVEAMLTESCSPVSFRAIYMFGTYVIDWLVGCRNSPGPQIDPHAPIWRFY